MRKSKRELSLCGQLTTELDLVEEKVTSRHGKFPKVHLSISCPEADCFVLNPYVTPLFEVLKGYIVLITF